MRAALALARLAFEDSTREPAYAVVVLSCAGAHALSPALAMFGFDDDSNLLKDFGVSTTLLAGAVLAAVALLPRGGAGGERAVLAKPVGRTLFTVSRFAGAALALGLFALVSTMSLLLAARHGPPLRAGHPFDGPVLAFGLGGAALAIALAAAASFRGRRPFGAGAVKSLGAALLGAVVLSGFFDRGWAPGPPLAGFDPLVLRASILAGLGTLVLGAVATLLSVILRGGSGFALAAVFVAALWIPPGSPAAALLPEVRAFSPGEIFYQASPTLPWSHVALAAAHAAACSGAALGAACWILERREAG